MNKAFLFPGQGSQAVRMGKDFYDAFTVARETFEIVNETLKFNLSKIIFDGPMEELTLTKNTQPALMAVSMAIFNTIIDQSNKDILKLCSYVAGHSLGEYSALCASSSLTLEDTTRLLQVRGTSMQEACASGLGSMAACIGIDLESLKKIINDLHEPGICSVANDNIEGQIVISGHTEIIERVIAILSDSGYKAVKLNVSAPFHCELMKPAEQKMVRALDSVTINKPHVPIITNVTADVTTDPQQIKQNLITQVCGGVRWRETLDRLVDLNVSEIIEIGSGKVLTGLARKANYPFKLTNIGTLKELDGFMGGL